MNMLAFRRFPSRFGGLSLLSFWSKKKKKKKKVRTQELRTREQNSAHLHGQGRVQLLICTDFLVGGSKGRRPEPARQPAMA